MTYIPLPDFSKGKVLVVGDIMLDRYLHGDTSRISPEAPVPIVHVKKTEERVGGAANVALNLATLGTHTTLLGITGDDSEAETLAQHLKAVGVNYHFERSKTLPTIKKMRIIGRNQQLIRLDFEEKFYYDNSDIPNLIAKYKKLLPEHNLVILSDYAKGALCAVQELIQAAKKLSIPVIVDPKSKDFSIYRGANLVTPNVSEFEAAAGPCQNDAELAAKALALAKNCAIDAILVTRGPQGMSLIMENISPLHIPAKAREVYDVTGAGDTVIATLGAALASGIKLAEAAELANLSASLVVRKLGTAAVTVGELRRALQRQKQLPWAGILNEAELLDEVAHAKQQGEKIVMTCGCFDILHPGHITYLERAKALGDRLIVAVNDDASVKRLKGPQRPLNDLQSRMALLAALRAVDWVVSFSEDVPHRIVAAVSPDIFVKGGDYKPEQVPEAKHVIKAGGRLAILPFVEGFSTTNLINKINSLK